jgi:hypothetical protein
MAEFPEAICFPFHFKMLESSLRLFNKCFLEQKIEAT